MAALDQARLDFGVTGVNEIQLKNWFRQVFWNWFDANRYEDVLTVKVWVFKKTIHVEDCQRIFEKFFGARPMTTGLQGVV